MVRRGKAALPSAQRRARLRLPPLETTMPITGPQARAARALVELSREDVAGRAGMSVEALRAFEVDRIDPGFDALVRLRAALEAGGAVFMDEDEFGRGVRLKFRAGMCARSGAWRTKAASRRRTTSSPATPVAPGRRGA